MSRDVRRRTLLELLVERGRLDVEEAARELGVSPATIRRDFDGLGGEERGGRAQGGGGGWGGLGGGLFGSKREGRGK
ncbi:DeoR family transcriptional regulator, partial [Streptomyces bottropensis]|uniref:DeoR family transcriptional regulator n=1 Tax=Streptomyces bottropensis TaxID=42235 RepID=UPI00367D7418